MGLAGGVGLLRGTPRAAAAAAPSPASVASPWLGVAAAPKLGVLTQTALEQHTQKHARGDQGQVLGPTPMTLREVSAGAGGHA
jgi:hypothetical protein